MPKIQYKEFNMNDVEIGDWVRYMPLIRGARPLIMAVTRITNAGIHLENGTVISPERVLAVRKEPHEG